MFINRSLFATYVGHRISGGILSIVLVICLLIATICTSLIVLAYYYKLSSTKSDISLRVIANAQSGFNYLLSQDWEESNYVTELKDLYRLGNDSILLSRKPWGFFDIGIASAFLGKHQHEKIGLIGAYPYAHGIDALYLSDEGIALKVSGDTEIRGNSYLPKMGIRGGEINGRGYSGSDYVYGAISDSESTLPSLTNKAIFSTEYFDDNLFLDNAVSIDKLENEMNVHFSQKTAYYYQGHRITLNEDLNGNLVIRSGSEINITARAKLNNIIVIAPKVSIEDNFNGKLQVIAGDTLIVGRNCEFTYPSVLAVRGKNENALITIGEGTQIFGVVYMNSLKGSHERKFLSIKEDATITGQVYINGMVEHKGEIYGSLICRSFLLRESNIHLNYLHDAVIDVSRRPNLYIGSPICFKPTKNGIIEWLY